MYCNVGAERFRASFGQDQREKKALFREGDWQAFLSEEGYFYMDIVFTVI